MSLISSQISVIFWLCEIYPLALRQAVTLWLPSASPFPLPAFWARQADRQTEEVVKNSCGGGRSSGATPRVGRIRLWFDMPLFPLSASELGSYT